MAARQRDDTAFERLCLRWKGICATGVTTISFVSLIAFSCWAHFAKPAIQEQIDVSIEPMRKAIVMLLCYKEAETDSLTKARAEYLYQKTVEWDKVKGK